MSVTESPKTEGRSSEGPRYWRSFDDLENTAEFQERLHREFQEEASEFPKDEVSRRRFLGVVAAGVAMAGLTSCRKPKQKVLPFSRRPENLLPGVARYYASSHLLHGYGIGTIVRSSDGRPTMVEGNPEHPFSTGGVDQYAIAELLNLYDPARSKHPHTKLDLKQFQVGGEHKKDDGHDDHGHGDGHAEAATLAHFGAALKQRIAAWTKNAGDGLRLLVSPTSSPTFNAQLDAFRKRYPKAVVHSYHPLSRDAVAKGSSLAFGKAYEAQHKADQADVIVGFDSDHQESGPEAVRLSQQIAKKRTPKAPGEPMSRLYAVESNYSLTGAAADHRFRVGTHEVLDTILALASELQSKHGIQLEGIDLARLNGSYQYCGKDWIPVLAKELASKLGRSLLICGPEQPPLAHAMVHALNTGLGNVGKTVRYTEMPKALSADSAASIQALCGDMKDGKVQDLVILGGNPLYDAPADLAFAEALEKVGSSIHLGLFEDETGSACTWHVNAAHPLEAWGDVLSYDGSLSFVQPLIAPLYDGISELEMVAMLNGAEEPSGHALVQELWKARSASMSFDGWWARALHDGVVKGTAFSAQTPALRSAEIAKAVAAHKTAAPRSLQNMEATFRSDNSVFDGRYANNAWMQELPDPMTKLVWDNAALMSKKTAAELGIGNGDLVDFSLQGRTLRMPVWIQPGMADHSVVFPLGYGRNMGEQCEVAKGAGFDTYKLRGTAAMGMAAGLSATKAGDSYKLVTTQDHGAMEGRAQVRENTLVGWKKDPTFAPDMNPLVDTAKVATERSKLEHPDKPKVVSEEELNQSLWKPEDMPVDHQYAKGEYQWGMTIDLNACTGCNACVVACQAENNIPTIGKEQVDNGRAMHWLRIDRYYNGEPYQGETIDGIPPLHEVASEENPQVVHQMVPCMQCEKAPCEVVCPVAATTHSPEGLNDMVYNRCIGTRYCSNNCPYKVRRFNYLDFHGDVPSTRAMQHNPDVTVRHRGVMEKCTYCVQRINGTKLKAKLEKRKVRDEELQSLTACASVCPTKAITFGNINDENSLVSKKKAQTRNYAMLAEVNTKPRTTYLARIRNPNPELLTELLTR